MIKVERSPGDNLRRRILRVHGTGLMLLTVTNMVIVTVGYHGGGGLYAALDTQPLGFGGLWQAYGIMFVIGMTLWIGSTQAQPRLFDVIGLAAHVPTFACLLIFPEATAQVFGGHLVALSLPVHTIGILVETFALLWKASWPTTLVGHLRS
jgi:hypothetical protein